MFDRVPVMLAKSRLLHNCVFAVLLMLFPECCILALYPSSPERNVCDAVGEFAGAGHLHTFHVKLC